MSDDLDTPAVRRSFTVVQHEPDVGDTIEVMEGEPLLAEYPFLRALARALEGDMELDLRLRTTATPWSWRLISPAPWSCTPEQYEERRQRLLGRVEQ